MATPAFRVLATSVDGFSSGTDFASIIPVVVLLILLLAVHFGVIAWIARDAEDRGRSGFLTALFVLFCGPSACLAWLVFRPEKRDR